MSDLTPFDRQCVDKDLTTMANALNDIRTYAANLSKSVPVSSERVCSALSQASLAFAEYAGSVRIAFTAQEGVEYGAVQAADTSDSDLTDLTEAIVEVLADSPFDNLRVEIFQD